jgi:methionine-rich copper-binding protein CopC
MYTAIPFNRNIKHLNLHKCPASYFLIFLFLLSFNCVSQQLYIGQGAYMVMNGHPVLAINNASFKNDGNIIEEKGTIKFTGNADTTVVYVSGSTPTTINNLIINKSAFGLALKSSLIVKDTLGISQGILYSNGYLTLKSTAEKTATVAALPVNGSGMATAYITGNVSIERFIKARKGWRFLSAPVKNTATSSTINMAWQEGVTAGNPTNGYGIQIIGGTTANGYDLAPTSNPSLKIYDNATDNIIGIPPVPGTHTAIGNYPGYFAFIWGNRSIDLFSGNVVATPTTLRMKGEIKSGDQLIPVNAFKYTVLGNPYPSAIDFSLLQRNNVRNSFYAWDPMLSGAYGVGGYVTVSWNGSSYDVTANSSDISQCIPSGSAVLIQSEDSATAGSVTVKESAKIFCNGQGPLARNGIKVQMSTLLYESNADGSRVLMDGVLTSYADHYSNARDEYDVVKLGAKYLGLKRGIDLFAIERRKIITVNDTVFLNLNALSSRNYQLNFILTNMDNNGVQAVLKDSYSALLNNKLLNMNDSNAIEFQVNSDPGSYAANRFFIVFRPLSPVPVTFTRVQAFKVAAGISIRWEVENELNIKEYVLEKSINGSTFYPIQTLPATAMNGQDVVYEYLDKAVVGGDNFYRVRSVSANAAIAHSLIVKVNVADVKKGIVVFPNPIEGNTVNIQTNNQPEGIYVFNIINSSGQNVFSDKAQVSHSQNVLLNLNKTLPAGIYQLESISPGHVKLINKIIIQ